MADTFGQFPANFRFSAALTLAKVTQERDQPRAQSEKQLWELGKQLTLMFQLDRDAKQWRPSWSKIDKKVVELLERKEQVKARAAQHRRGQEAQGKPAGAALHQGQD